MRPLRSLLSFGLALAALAAAPAAAQPEAELIKEKTNPEGRCFKGAQPPPRPALWEVADEDSRIFLFGTVHVLPSATCWQDMRVTRAIWASDELVTEIEGDYSPMRMIGYLAEAAFDPANPPLRERLDPRYHPTLDRLIAQSPLPLPESFYDKIDSWALTEFLFEGLLVEPGGDPADDSGVEAELEFQFAAARKPRSALETLEYQLKMSDAYSDELQAAWLDSWFAAQAGDAGPGGGSDPLGGDAWEDILEAWRVGEPIDIAAYLEAAGPAFVTDDAAGAARLTQEYLEVLLYARNRNWVDWIEQRLERPGTVFVAVGAGHLGGERSVIDYATRRGLPVRRID